MSFIPACDYPQEDEGTSCGSFAVYRYKWPENDIEHFTCEGHAQMLQELAEVLGLDLWLIVICPTCLDNYRNARKLEAGSK